MDHVRDFRTRSRTCYTEGQETPELKWTVDFGDSCWVPLFAHRPETLSSEADFSILHVPHIILRSLSCPQIYSGISPEKENNCHYPRLLGKNEASP